MITNSAPEKTTDKRTCYAVILIVSVTTFITLLNIHSINIALVTIASEFDISESKVSLIPQAYLIALCSFIPFVGKLAESYNTKRMFLFGLFLFVTSSILCATTDRFELLVGWRAIQGGSAAILQTVGMLMQIRILPPEIRGKAFGVNGMFASFGLILGAPIGGFFSAWLGWHWVFVLCVPMCIIPLIIVLMYLPDISESQAEGGMKKLDIKGALLSAYSLSLLMYGVHLGVEEGWDDPATYSLLAVSAVLCGWLWYHLKNHENPIIDLRLFRNGAYALSLLVIFFANMMITGNCFVIPFFLNEIHHLPTEEIGLIFLFFSISYMIISPIAGIVSDKISALCTLMVGVALCVIAYGSFFIELKEAGLYLVYIFLFLLGGGLSLVFIAGCAFSFEHAPSDRSGEASALYRLTGLLGASCGVNLFSSLLTLNGVGSVDQMVDYQWIYGISFGFSVIILFLLLKFRHKRRTINCVRI